MEEKKMKKFLEFEKGLEEMQKKYEEMKGELFASKKKEEKEEKEKKPRKPRKMKRRMGVLPQSPIFGSVFDDYEMFGGRGRYWFDNDDDFYSQSIFGGGLPFMRRRPYLPQLETPIPEEKTKPKKKKKKVSENVEPYSYSSHYSYQKVNDREHENKRVMDSRTGYSEVETRKIGDRGYSIEKEKKLGEEKENEKKTFHNLDEKELGSFEKEWDEKFEKKEKKEKMIEGKASVEEEEDGEGEKKKE